MIWYTYKADTNVIINQFVELSSDNQSVQLHTTGTIIGVCIGKETTEDTQETVAKIYTAGGSGELGVLHTSWNGSPTRFDVVAGKVNPVQTGGIGWIIPEYPQTAKSENDLVRIALY